MRLGIIADWRERGFEFVEKMGLSEIEICVNVGDNVADFCAESQSIAARANEKGIKVCSLGRFGAERVLNSGEINDKEYKSDIEMIDAAQAIGAPYYLVGVNYAETKDYNWNIDNAVSYLTKLCKYAQTKNVQVLVYNCSWGNFIYDQKGWDAVLPRVPELGIKYDPSHCFGRGGDILKELRDFGKFVKHFHVKGTIYIDGQHFDDPPAGLDQIPWGPVMDTLYACDYNGTLSIEPHSSIWSGARGEWGIRFTIDFMSKFIMPETGKEIKKS